ncbi:MAG: hypothetical protein M0Z31_10120 [Clostridia bacterium]|nr:hypothetical protein [Clostridia bacterium]
MPISKPESNLNLKVVLTPFIAGKVDRQIINIYVNGKNIGKWTARNAGEYTIEIPQSSVTDPLLKISFEMPDATSPLAAKINNDPRNLGIAVQTIIISEKK